MSANSESIFVWSRGAIKTIQIPIRLFCWVSILHPVNGKATWILLCIFFSRYCAQFCFAIKEIQPSEPRASESLNFLIVRSCFFFCFVLFCFSLLPRSQKARSSPPVQCNAGLDSGKSSNEPPSRRIENFLFWLQRSVRCFCTLLLKSNGSLELGFVFILVLLTDRKK